MTVAYLAQAVGEAIGANTLLLRIGAYYHDIGKMVNPKFFSENQSSGKNTHDELDPRESVKLIINHVKYGVSLGRQMDLPEIVLDHVAQHHGTQVVEFFYDKAVEASKGSEPRKLDFRYPGPKPQTVEAAILMIVDAVEAASRSMEEPTREKIEKMIRLLVVKRIADGQFDECNLSTRYLAKIVQTLVDSLEASLHSRVVYPWQERVKKASVARIEDKVRRRSVSIR
jgi:putative nucleotidyltransferase with HDIG domain